MYLDILEIILPILVGISLGMIGGGGTVLAVPILIYIYGINSKSAIGMSLGIVCFVSFVGSYFHWKQKNIRLELAAYFTPFAMLGAYIGAKIASLPFITSSLQMILFGSTVLISSLFMIFKKSDPESEPETNTNKDSTSITEENLNNKNKFIIMGIQGVLVGILTGLVGVGGGFLIVPALVFFGRLPIREAIGTSLVVIFFNSMSGFLGYINKVNIDYMVILYFGGLSVIGVIFGVHYGQKLPKQNLQKIFGLFLFVLGLWILWGQTADNLN
ncbi:sulfite exporter TauE/SafE family protein [Leptospira sp. GIMC2001]|uniref:sulfite exporter TauE/SafE family protein n=1 Tax=Leptospira sp. GIMC2001 TaxID=1513297 RepID=UPI00234A32E3|nr:sulfite exporter TauE/SafE family protein [Leptospira sp. GIMC2001]WCL50000.1 sulfite exporter TauE/SafE family protein [Leptospira sp. GIMC2001]